MNLDAVKIDDCSFRRFLARLMQRICRGLKNIFTDSVWYH